MYVLCMYFWFLSYCVGFPTTLIEWAVLNSIKVALAIGHWQLTIRRLGIRDTMQCFAWVTSNNSFPIPNCPMPKATFIELGIYSILCRRYNTIYIKETGRWLHERFSEHFCIIRNQSPGFPVAEHFNLPEHSVDNTMVCGFKECTGNNTCLICKLGTIRPSGLNINFSFLCVLLTFFMCTYLLSVFRLA